MARARAKIDKRQMGALVDAMIADAVTFDGLERRERRQNSLRYMAGEVPDIVPGKNSSSVVSQDIADAKSQLLPSLMRVFCASDRVGIYEPQQPEDEDFAEQATDYANYVFLRECNGEMLLRDTFDDGLGLGNGIIKHWWDDAKEYKTETLTGLDEATFVDLVSNDDVEVLEHSEYPDPNTQGPEAALGLPLGMAAPAAPAGMGAGNDLGAAFDAAPAVPQQAPPSGPMAPGAMAVGQQPPAAGQGAALGVAPGVNGDGPTAPGTPEGASIDRLGIGGNFPPEPIALLHDVKIRRVTRNGRLRIVAVPDEDFGIESGATGLNEDECRFCYHRETPTRSQLIERGYDPADVDNLLSIDASPDDGSRRRNTSPNRTEFDEEFEDRAGERVEIFECYALIDVDGDGITEWHQIIVGGATGTREVLRSTEWGGLLPFTDIVPDPIPHVWRGRSLYDRLRDIQRVNTVLMRKTLDNTYQVVEPGIIADMRFVKNPDALFNRSLGQVIRVDGDPRSVIAENVVSPIAQFTMPIMEEMRKVAERRVGVGEQSSGLDADALQGQVATAVAATQSASALRKEDYARNIQMGVQRLFRAILRISVENQDRERVIRLRGKWVTIDPRGWNADMDVTVNVGLGAGNRDRDLAMLQGIAAKQEQIIATQGLDNGWVGLKEYANTLTMMTEAAGVRGASRFFPEVTDELMAVMAQKLAARAQQPDPKMAAEQGKLQLAAQKAQMDAQIQQQKMQAAQALQQADAQAKAQLSAAEMQQKQALMEAQFHADLRVREAEMQHTMELDRVKNQRQMEAENMRAQFDMRLKMRELEIEASLKREQYAMGLNRGTNVEFPA